MFTCKQLTQVMLRMAWMIQGRIEGIKAVPGLRPHGSAHREKLGPLTGEVDESESLKLLMLS